MTSDVRDDSDTTAPLVTTVIPTYRRPSLLRRAIASAVEQADVKVRVAVFDNCSGDETGDVVASMALRHSQIVYHCHPRNLGAYANFDSGVRSVSTPFFSILSDDDYLLPGFYQRALAGFRAYPEAMFWVGMTLNVDESGTIWDARVGRWPRDGVFNPPEGAMAMTGGKAPAWTGILFRREVLELAGFIDPETAGPSDLDYTIRLATRFPYVVEKIPVAVFTQNSQSFSATQPLAAFWPGWLKMFQNVRTLPGMVAIDRERLLVALHHDARRMLFRRGINAIAAGRHDYARDAAEALSRDYRRYANAAVLRWLCLGCARIPGVQWIISTCYRLLERRIVRSRAALQRCYGSLLRSS